MTESLSQKTQSYGDDWESYMLPNESGNFSITPLAVIDHARNEEDRELIKELDTDELTGNDVAVYRVLSGVEYDEDDSTQSNWRIEYGLECTEDGLSRAFLNIPGEDIEEPEAYAESIAEDIFPALKERTDEYYDRS